MRRARKEGSARSGALALFACAVALTVVPARAQKAPEVGKADALFNAGRSLLEAGEYADACPKFAESQKLAPGLGVTLYLADCYERLGRTASALVEFKRAVKIASTRGDKRGAIAAERAATLEGRVPQLLLQLTPAARAQDVTVTRDGDTVPSAQWDTAMAIDPGDHEIVVTAPSKQTRHVTVKLAAQKGVVTTTIDALEDPPPLQPLLSSTAEATAPVPPPSKTQKWVGIGVGSAGVVGLGVGAVFGILAITKLHQSNDGPCDQATDQCSTAGMGLRQDSLHFGNASTVALSIGGAALVGGVVLFVTAPKSSSSSVGLVFTPVVSSENMGLRVGSRF
jgi:hypothetical protein